MKKFIKYAGLSLVALAAVACSDFLKVNPQDSQVKETYYKSAEAVRQNTASLYGVVWFDFSCRFMYMGGDMLAGDLFYTYADEGQFYLNTVQPGNQYSLSGWRGLYRVVSYANAIINEMPEAARSNGVAESVIEAALGEAYTFRAMAYYYLTEYWHEVPIIENATDLITSGNPSDIYVNKNTQSNLYRFMCEDLERAMAMLPASDEAGRVTKYSAEGLLAKVYLTRGCYEHKAEYFEKAKSHAENVIKNGPQLYPNYSELYEVAGNNCSESLIAIQCLTGGYGYGNSRSTEWGRRDALTGVSCWGAGKGPTLSLQEEFEKHPNDGRRKWVYMKDGDRYPTLGVGQEDYPDGYVYGIFSMDGSTEVNNECMSHIKKYVINSDNGAHIGTMQDAANNLYLLRVADVYFVYAEACLAGDINATLADATAIGYVNQVLNRGGDSDAGYTVESLTYEKLIKERRKEFAMEGCNWFDIKRMYYIDPTAALRYLNDMYRDKVWVFDWTTFGEQYGTSYTEEQMYEARNDMSYYHRNWYTTVDNENFEDVGPNPTPNTDNRAAAIVMQPSNMVIALPSEVTTKAPILLEPAVDYYANK